MTEEEKKAILEKYKNAPTSELIKKLFILLGKYVLAWILHILILIIKGFIWCIKKCSEGIQALNVFWHSSDTQEKKKKIIILIRIGLRKLVRWCKIAWAYIKKYTLIGAHYTWDYTRIGCRLFFKYFLITVISIWHGILWTGRTAKDLVIHSKPTFIRLGKSIKQGFKDFGHWTVNVGRGIRLRRIRRKRAWQNFRKNKGFKGLLVDMGHGLNRGITSYMTEDDTDSGHDVITDDDFLEEKFAEHQGDKESLGAKFFKIVKNIVEEN